MKKKLLIGLTSILLFCVSSSYAIETVRELWDKIGKSEVGTAGSPPSVSTTINGFGNGSTSFGFQPGSVWYTPVPTNGLIQCDINFDDNPGIGLPTKASSQGGLWSDVFWGVDQTIPVNSSSNWASRLLATNAWINFNSNGVYYFSLDANDSGNSAGGMAFGTGTNLTDRFVGCGIIWESYPQLDSGLDIGNSTYVCQGSFGDPSDTNTTLPEAQGLYAIKAYGDINLNSGQSLLVGKITTTFGGATTIQIKDYSPFTNPTLDTNEPVVWDATYSFTETNIMKYLFVFMNSEGASYPYFEQGAMRVATSWPEIVGMESFQPTASPSNTVPAGTTVTLTNIVLTAAGATPTYQWQVNGTNILNATNKSYTVANPATTNSGGYAMVLSNAFGVSTSAVLNVTITPVSPPSFTVQPQLPTARFSSGSITLTPQVQGTPPLSYQWFQNNASLTGATNLSLVLNNIVSTNAGNYYLHVSNTYGSTNSSTNLFTVIVPTGFDAAVVADQPFGYWQLSETNGPVLHDYYTGNDGSAPDGTNYIFGVPGPALAGFSANQASLSPIGGLDTNGNALPASQLNLPAPLVWTNTVTIVGWVEFPGANYPGAGSGLIVEQEPDYGVAYGLVTADAAGQLGWDWGSSGQNSASGLIIPTNQWTFIAMVVEPDQITAYVGTNQLSLTTDTSSLNSNVETGLAPTVDPVDSVIEVGRDDLPYSDAGASRTITAQFSDVAVFNTSLTPQQILNLYAAGVGFTIQATPNGSGSVLLNWLPGATLQQATSATGPYNDVIGATPPYQVFTTGPQMFYRVRL
jgi:hypothetical protein